MSRRHIELPSLHLDRFILMAERRMRLINLSCLLLIGVAQLLLLLLCLSPWPHNCPWLQMATMRGGSACILLGVPMRWESVSHTQRVGVACLASSVLLFFLYLVG